MAKSGSRKRFARLALPSQPKLVLTRDSWKQYQWHPVPGGAQRQHITDEMESCNKMMQWQFLLHLALTGPNVTSWKREAGEMLTLKARIGRIWSHWVRLSHWLRLKWRVPWSRFVIQIKSIRWKNNMNMFKYFIDLFQRWSETEGQRIFHLLVYCPNRHLYLC